MRTCAVAAAALLIAACAGTRHDAESSNVRNGSEAGPHAPVETDTNANAKVPEIPVELSPQIHEACRPYRIAEPALTLPSNSDSKVRREFGGLTHCLTHGPLHDHELEIVGPDPAKSYLSEAVEPLRRVLIDGGVNAYRLKIVPAADADRVTLRLGNPESDS
ncbi:MAG TPA: hypothetical protein VFU02_02255 [Polyangiaceae bacterium]|nr:hypothetical protein [Polyangiaceae bacterium]